MKKILKNNATLIALIGIAVLLTFLSGGDFLTPRNLTNVFRQVTIIGVIAVGMTMVILLGGIDLSVGSVVGLSAVVVTMLMEKGIPVWLAVVLTILITGVAIGAWNGFWIAHYKIPAFIITLGMMTIARGLALTLSGGSSIPVRNNLFPKIGGEYISTNISGIVILALLGFVIYMTFAKIKKQKQYGLEINKGKLFGGLIAKIVGVLFLFWVFIAYKGIPVPVAIFAVLVLLGVFILRKTKFGRNIYATGGNEEAARLSGINIFKINMYVFMAVTTLSSISGIILASRLNGASPNLGNMFELDTIAAVVIGGTSLSGGSGTITGSIIGAFIIGIINNGMSLMGVPSFYQLIVKGAIIIIAVWFDVLNKKKKA
ncbi:MAG: sugar ABC transporter permease [Fusobacteriota bacterium]